MGILGAECITVNTDAVYSLQKKVHKKASTQEFAKHFGYDDDSKANQVVFGGTKRQMEDLLADTSIVFIATGIGDQKEISEASVVADIARRKGAIAIGVVKTPSSVRKNQAKDVANVLIEMRKRCDTVVVVDNNKLASKISPISRNKFSHAADQVLANVIKGVVETISAPSLINLDFAGFKTVVKQGGLATVGVGESNAPNRAEEAARNALTNPLSDGGYAGATGALVHVAGDNQMTVEEANRVGEIVTEMMDHNALVIWGAKVNPEQKGKLKVTLVMTGVDSSPIKQSLRAIAPQLFDMEPYIEPEKPLNLKLDLYQMEDF